MAGFLKLEGMKGDAVAAGHEGWIPVISVTLGNLQRASMSVGTYASIRPGGQTEVHLAARPGNHSDDLHRAVTQGTHHDGELALTGARGHYATVRLPGAIVTNYSTGVGGTSDYATETFTLTTAAPYKYEPTPRAVMPGRWLVTIGNWTGYFVFEPTGTVYWSESNGTGRHNGLWKATATDVQWKFAGAGDIRTFVIPVPITSDTIGGRILPVGQGFFTMKRT